MRLRRIPRHVNFEYPPWAPSVRRNRSRSKLSYDPHLFLIIAKANKLLGLLPMLTDTTVRRTLNLSNVKSQLCYISQVWSPAQKITSSEDRTSPEASSKMDYLGEDW